MKNERVELERIVGEEIDAIRFEISPGLANVANNIVNRVMVWRYGDTVCPACGREK